MSEHAVPQRADGLYLETREHPCDIVVYTRGWEADHPVEDGEAPTAQFGARVFVNGSEIEQAAGITVHAENDFMTADVKLIVSTIQFVPLGKDAWRELGRQS